MLKKLIKKMFVPRPTRLQHEIARIGELEFEVLKHTWFWKKFNKGLWEKPTFDFYKRNVSPLYEVVDIGAWIGPTVFIAYANNPAFIHAVEADTVNFHNLNYNVQKNFINHKIRLNNLCIYSVSGETVSFGNIENISCSSQKQINLNRKGQTPEIQTITLEDYLKTKDMSRINIVKIDIEGGEQFIEDGLDYISKNHPEIGLKVLLSVHVGFFADKTATKEMLLRQIEKFELFDENENPMEIETFKEHFDNVGFFAIVLKTR